MRSNVKKQNNFAFIDGQNLYLGISELGWELDFRRFRVYLSDRYSVNVAYYFLGYIPSQKKLYEHLQRCGFTLMFKEVSQDDKGKVKGNIDVDLTLHTMRTLPEYDQAILVTSDGDFAPLVEFLISGDKFLRVLSPEHKACSKLLRKYAKSKVDYLDFAKEKLKKHP